MNALRRKQQGTYSLGMDVPATLASFRLFFMLSARAGAPVDAIRFTFLNAALIEAAIAQPYLAALDKKQVVTTLVKNGLDLQYGFVWLSA
jgi:hypothetical protein